MLIASATSVHAGGKKTFLNIAQKDLTTSVERSMNEMKINDTTPMDDELAQENFEYAESPSCEKKKEGKGGSMDTPTVGRSSLQLKREMRLDTIHIVGLSAEYDEDKHYSDFKIKLFQNDTDTPLRRISFCQTEKDEQRNTPQMGCLIPKNHQDTQVSAFEEEKEEPIQKGGNQLRWPENM